MKLQVLHFLCWFWHGHADILQVLPATADFDGRMFLKCCDCGRETHGWTF